MTAMLAAGRYKKMNERAATGAMGQRQEGLTNAKKELQPYVDYGKQGMERQNRLFNDPSYLEQTGGYKFAMDQGLKATTAARSNTSIFSGETMKALTDYAAGLASQTYDAEWNRFQKQIDIGAGASQSAAEIEAAKGEAGARMFDQRAAWVAGEQGFHQQISGQWSSAFASASASSAMMCWVAEELYGVDDEKTHVVRAYTTKHLEDDSVIGQFCRVYNVNGKEWAQRVKHDPKAREDARVIWDQLYAAALEENA